MRKCLILSFLAFVLAVTLVMQGVLAAGNVDYQIIEDKVLVELNLDEVSDFSYRLPFDVETIDVNVNHEIVDFDMYKLLEISFARNVEISYVDNGLIEKSKDRYFFIIKNQFDDVVDVNLFLDEGAVLAEDERLIVPEPSSVGTDGRRIILSWNDFDAGEIVVEYELVGEDSFVLRLVIILVILLFVWLYYRQSARIKKEVVKAKEKLKLKKERAIVEKRKGYTRNLFGEEKKIIEYLLSVKGNECWTKELVRNLGISKVRLSRKLRNLEQKDLIIRIPYGNENKVRLKK